MIEMFVSHVGIDEKTGCPLLILSDKRSSRCIPIIVSETETIRLAVRDADSREARDQNLMLQTFRAFGYTVSEVCFFRHQPNLYSGRITLIPIGGKGNRGTKVLDTGVSHAVAVAVYAQIPVLVPEEVMLEASVPVNQQKDLEETQRFRKFLEGTYASDFKLPSGAQG